jgi:outer membrane lipoprotein SlyB
MNARIHPILMTVVAAAALTACGSPPRDRAAAAPVPVYEQRVSAEYGTVRSIEVVPAASHHSATGAVLGAVIGAAVGNQFGSGTGRAAATGLGAVGGAVVGDRIGAQRDARSDELYRVAVRFDNGDIASFDFQQVGDLRVGDRVRYDGRQLYRI